MEMMLQTTDLCKIFQKQKAVNKISMHVRKGTVYGLLGPNGAGKSTTLKMLTGIFSPTSGEIFFDGKPWNRQVLSEIGALIESPPIYDNLSARENLKVRSLLLGVNEKRIDNVLRIVSLTGTGKKKAGQFSMGMKQRLGIAMALLGKPKLLILDEPTNGLDPIGIEELRALIRSFPEQGITVILSSHILSEVQLIADDVGIISNGILGYESPLEEGQNLEELFMHVVKENRKTGDICG
ncbi:MAG: lantibiotic protection ABC transporter ATP-binding protein [Lachnospiraceae bacterium]|nr:lantibiotic protection ABC transporter ATP-binding protein [Lachnospiraceae bacterium]MCI9135344.1 lantibiotic protection ABC transporter ATP-binding protein [Lachnospiraceae bacterium]